MEFNQNDVDLCPHCAALDEKVFTIKEIPEIPTEQCTSQNGCACRLEPSGSDEDGDGSFVVAVHGESDELLEDSNDDPVEKLRQIKQMLDEGLIEQDEYPQKKKEILARM